MHLALLQVNPRVGDIEGNARKVIDAAQAVDADLIIAPELVVCGYPPRDLLYQAGFVEACEAAVSQIAEACRDRAIIVGHPRRDAATGRLRNAASLLRGGMIEAVCDKQLLPGYDVFDEDRYFEPGESICVVDIDGHRVGIAICEDLWQGGDAGASSRYDHDPITAIMSAGCNIIVVPSATPFVTGKRCRHLEQLMDTAASHNVTVAMVNQLGANDDLIFDGGAMVAGPQGLLLDAVPFDGASVTVDTSGPSVQACKANDMDMRYRALVLGLGDYCSKTGHDRVLLGISGGIDSALVAVIAASALGPDAVAGVLMPSRYSSRGSVEDAEALAANLGLTHTPTLPIEHLHAAFERTMTDAMQHVSSLTEENAQARARGLLLMAMANEADALLLATGNKSELAMGYCTLYGDMCGAVSVIGDMLKTDVWEMAHWINEHHADLGFSVPPIPEATISKPPSAELRLNQCDQDTLPPYETLDAIVRAYIEEERGVEDTADHTGLDLAFVRSIIASIDRAQFKRDQAAVIPKISPRTFGRGRPMPIVMRRSGTNVRQSAEGESP